MRNILEWLEAAASQTPDQIALAKPDDAITWKKLKEKAVRLGSGIAQKIPMQSPVLILMEKGPACIAAMMGSVYAGCFYTPLDSSMPVSRMKIIADILDPALILCEEAFLDAAKELKQDCEIRTLSEVETEPDERLLLHRREEHIDNDLLYVLFTSGSTGIPKGVSITHRSVIDYIEWACRELKLPQGVCFGSQAPFYFDNSVLDIYGSMASCGCLYIIPREQFLFPAKMLKTLEETKIDTLFWVPSALTSLSKNLEQRPEALTGLKRIFFCGEIMPCSTLNRWKAVLPDADYVNMYGPTEITDVCSWYRVDREFADTDNLPIGKPCSNTRIYLIEDEICVAGTCLSPGYYNAPEKTMQAFVQNPLRPQIQEMIYRTGDLGTYNERGELMFLGRRDGQIKKSGYRIELGEIECAVSGCENVIMSCCFYDAQKEKILAVYTGTATKKEIKAFLKKVLPRYMMPDILILRETMPLTGNGKIDRLTLKKEIWDEYTVL